MMKYYVNSLRDDVVEELQNMDVFMGKGKYVGPKNKKDTAKKVEDVSNKSVKDALTELKNLLGENLITNEEYEQKRKEILKRL